MDDVFEASCFTMRRVVRHRIAIADPIWVVVTLSKTEAHSVTSLCNGNGCPTEPSTSIVEATYSIVLLSLWQQRLQTSRMHSHSP